ncbi:MAG: pilt protein domain protein [Microgenomates group bacterium Gr01-1014_7]|nr:MAG: pilt protein domain protein [Microgenomates group bacterium Gr01-1014_7]
MISAVLDTNILASGTVTALTPPGQILDRWCDGQFELIVSEHIIEELESTLKKPYFQKHLSTKAKIAYMELLQTETTVTPITVNVKGVATHPEDDLVLATAISAKADYLVTGDGPLIRKVGKKYKGVTLISPTDFLEILKEL